MMRPFWRRDTTAVGVIILMYAAKFVTKLYTGFEFNSPMFAGDGFHNVSDLFAALVLLVTVRADTESNETYPFGRKNIESLASLVIGLGLFAVAAYTALGTLVGLLSYAPSADAFVRSIVSLPKHQPVMLGEGHHLAWALGITIPGAALSFLLGRYETSVGKDTGHPLMVADGKDTTMDGHVEVAALVGVCFDYAVGGAWPEYLIGCYVVVLMVRTGREIVVDAWRTLLQKSLGLEVEKEIRSGCLGLRGIDEVSRLQTFKVGGTPVCILQVRSRIPAEAQKDAKLALKERIRLVLAKEGLPESRYLYLSFSQPDADPHRIAYAVTEMGGSLIAAEGLESKHWLLCDVEHGRVVRSTRETVPDACRTTVADWLSAKAVRTAFALKPDREDHEAARQAGIMLAVCRLKDPFSLF